MVKFDVEKIIPRIRRFEQAGHGATKSDVQSDASTLPADCDDLLRIAAALRATHVAANPNARRHRR